MRWNALGIVHLTAVGLLSARTVGAQEPAPAPSPSPAAPVAASPAPASAQPAAAAPQPQRPPLRGGNDQRRTVRSYPANLAYNFLGVLTPGNYPVLAAGTVLTAPCLALDRQVDDYFAAHPQKKLGDIGAALGGGLAVSGLTIGFFSAGRVARGDRFRATTYDVSQAIIVNYAYTTAIKLAVGRERPDHSNRQSFPSGHASNAFAGATVIARHYGDVLGVPAYAVATLIATSRLASHRHHLSDVVAGAAFGYGVGRAVVRRNSRPPDDAPSAARASTVMVGPDGGPAGDGVGLRLTARF